MLPIPNQPGRSLTREEVLFVWALSEAFSPRWCEEISQGLEGELRAKIARGQSSGYTQREARALIDLLLERRKPMIMDTIGKASRFTLIQVPAELLELLPVLPECGWKEYPVLLGHYLDGPHNPDSPHDPRACAARYQTSPPPSHFPGYPIIAYNEKLRCDTLLDGYSRCIGAILKKRAALTVREMLMIYCRR